MARSGLALSACVTVTLLVSMGQAKPDSVDELLTKARAALGPAQQLDALRSLRLTGERRTAIGSGEQVTAIEILIALPDKYLRSERRAGSQATVSSGFNGAGLVLMTVPRPGAAPQIPPASQVARPGLTPEENARIIAGTLNGVRREFLAMVTPRLLRSFAGSPMSFRKMTTDSRGYLVSLEGDGFQGELLIAAGSYRVTSLKVIAPGDSPGQPPRVTVYEYSDYVTNNGVTWPARTIKTVDGGSPEVTVFSAAEVNVPTNEAQFSVIK